MKFGKSLGLKSILSIALLLVLLFSASYAFFNAYNIPNSDISTSIAYTDMVYTLKGGSELILDFDPITFKTIGEGYDDATVSTDYVELQASSHIPNMSCTYEIWYNPIVPFENSSNNTGVVEFELIGKDLTGTNAPFTLDLAGITTSQMVSNGVITTYGSNSLVRQNYEFTLRHYNRDFLQNDHIGKQYSSQITFKSTGCTPNENVITKSIGLDQNNQRILVTVENMEAETVSSLKSALTANNTLGLSASEINNAKIVNITANNHTGVVNVSLDFSSLINQEDDISLYRYDGSSWSLVDNYSISDGVLTISTSSFSPFMIVTKDEVIPTIEGDYTGYYADTNDDGTIDGVIFFDYMYGADTRAGFFGKGVAVSPITEGLNTYELKTVKGHENVVVPTSSDKQDRFYVIDMQDSLPTTPVSSKYAYWYYSAYTTKISDYATVTSTSFGSGKTNTATMKEKWNSGSYGTKNNRDIWSINMGEKFIPSKDEWLVLGSNLKKIATGPYSNMTFPSGAKLTFNDWYWSSSLYRVNYAWYAIFVLNSMDYSSIDSDLYARLALTF